MSILSVKEHKKGLIKTKYNRPGLNQYIISRQCLYAKLDNSIKCKLMLVTAPAGFGKTTAVLDWLDKRCLKAAWLSVDSGDNDPITFWRYICAALDIIVSGIAKDTEYVFRSHEPFNTNMYLSILINRLMEVETDFLFILDDVHFITNSAILDGLSYLIDYLPPKMHMVFIGRFEPKFELARLSIKTQILTIRAKDLRFRNEEINRFYQIRGFALGNDDIQKVESYTEGWAAALVAAAMSMEDDIDRQNAVQNLESSRTSINRYLEEEVLSSWTEEKQSFALNTSILDTLCASLCDAVTGKNNGNRMLKEINEMNGFLISMDNEEYEYRYCYLLRSFLYKLLLESDPNAVLELHEKAAAWYRDKGIHFQAIEHYLSAKRYDEAFELIELQLSNIAHNNDYTKAFHWINRLPEEYKDKSIKICSVYALYYAENNRFEQSREWIGKMEVLAVSSKYAATPKGNGFAKILCRLVKANLAAREGKLGEFFSLIKSASEINAEKYYLMAGYMDINPTDIYFYRCSFSKMTLMFERGNDKYSKMIRNYRRMITNNPGYAPLIAGEYLYEKNKLEEALPYLLEAIDEAYSANCPGALVPAMVDVARIKRARVDIEGAFEVLEECEKRLQSSKPHWNYLINSFRVRLSLAVGNMEAVDTWFDSCKLGIFAEISRSSEFELIVYSRVLMVKGRIDDAELLLKRLLAYTLDAVRQHSRVEILNLLAIMAYQKGEIPIAMNYFEKSLLAGMKEGYVRSYIDEYDKMYNLLRYYIMYNKKRKVQHVADKLTAYAKSLLDQMQKNTYQVWGASSEAASCGIKKILTNQEEKILELLLAACTNEEIGQKLGISLRTVKAHTGNIYNKLKVKNRAQCVKMARESHLLE